MGEREGFIVFYPSEKSQFAEGSDTWEALNKGWTVSMALREPYAYDIWDPATGKLYDLMGNEIGWRDRPFNAEDIEGSVLAGNQTLKPADLFDGMPEDVKAWLRKGYWVSINEHTSIIDIWHPDTKAVVNKKGQLLSVRDNPYLTTVAGFVTGTPLTIEALGFPQVILDWAEGLASEQPTAEITMDKDKAFVEMWDPETGEVFDFDLNVTGKRAFSFNAHASKKLTGETRTYTRAERLNDELSDVVQALLRDGKEVTITAGGDIIDIRNPDNDVLLDTNKNFIGTRIYPFPSTNKLREVEADIKRLTNGLANLQGERHDVDRFILPRGWDIMGYDNGIAYGGTTEALRTIRDEIFAQQGNFGCKYDTEGIVRVIWDFLGEWDATIENNDISTLKVINRSFRGRPNLLDPALLTASFAEIDGEISTHKDQLKQRQTWLRLMKRYKKRIRITDLIQKVNK